MLTLTCNIYSSCADAPVLEFHEVEDITAAPDEENLHGKVVQRDPLAPEDVEVTGDEDSDIERLCLERDTYIRPRKIPTNKNTCPATATSGW